MKIETIRHSLAHIMAASVQELYPGTKFGIGPIIENGFYYDFALPSEALAKEGFLPKIEEKMKELIKQNIVFKKKIISKKEAKEIFKNQPYKLELIEEIARVAELHSSSRRRDGRRNLFLRPSPTEPLDRGARGEKRTKFSANASLRSAVAETSSHLPPRPAQQAGRGSAVEPVQIYRSGGFVDLCLGPHVKSTKEINADAFKLTKIAGAYWRGNEKNPMLTRIYGVGFKTKKELNDYLVKEAEAEKRDHRLLGQKLELFMFDEEVGAGLPLWMPKGTILRKIIENYLEEELKKEGYLWVVTPHIGKLKLWQTSGHWDLYRENMYSAIKIEEEEYMIKPMNCPFHSKIYQSKIRSYKDLPLKYAELGTVYRYERSGVLHGLTRVRGFTQDDAHIWCAPEQLSDELIKLLKHGLKILKTFGFKDYEIYLSTKPEKFAGTEKMWQKATNSLKYVLKKLKLKYQADIGGGVFYGPKIDIKIKDSLGRPWQCTTIQVDFNLPERLDITYISQKGRKQRPTMVHRALLGSIERFVGVLLEHYGGALPLWLTPEQIWIIPVGSRHKKYANSVRDRISNSGYRVELKDENETVSKKIREGELQKIPYLLVVGDKEMKAKSVRVRKRGKGDIGLIKLSKFMEKVKKEIERKK